MCGLPGPHGLTDDQIKFEGFASFQPGRAKTRVVSRAKAKAGNPVSRWNWSC